MLYLLFYLLSALIVISAALSTDNLAEIKSAYSTTKLITDTEPTTTPKTTRTLKPATAPTTNTPPRSTKTPTTPPYDTECYDRLATCADHELGYCSNKQYEFVIKISCAKTCGFCTPTDKCKLANKERRFDVMLFFS